MASNVTKPRVTNKTATARDIVVRNILSFPSPPRISSVRLRPPLHPPPIYLSSALLSTSPTLPIPQRILHHALRSNSGFSAQNHNEVRQEPEQPDRGDAPRLARQVPVLQGPQEAAQANRRRRRRRRAAEQAPAHGRRRRRRLLAGDDPGGGRVCRPPGRRARQVQRLLPREGGGLRHPAEGVTGQGGERRGDGLGGGAAAGAEGDRRLPRRDGPPRELQRAQLHRTGQDPQEVRQEDRRTDPPALYPERNAGAILRYRRPVQARQGVRGDAGPAPAPEPAVCAKRRRRERRQRQRRQAGEAQRLAGQRQWHWGHGAGGNRGHGEHVHEEHGGRTQGAQGDKERELHSERILPAATTVRAELAAAVAMTGVIDMMCCAYNLLLILALLLIRASWLVLKEDMPLRCCVMYTTTQCLLHT